MTPQQDAHASLALALQKIERAQRALKSRNLPWIGSELVLAKLSIEDAQSVLTTDEPGHVVTCDPAFHGGLVE